VVERTERLATATLEVLATLGARGLTHRAVDTRAGLPPGSVNYYFKTRDQLLELALTELFRHDGLAVGTEGVRRITDRDTLAVALAHAVTTLSSGDAAVRQRARYELLLESGRRPGFARIFAEQRASFVALLRPALDRTGCPTAGAHADDLLAFVDGQISRHVLFGLPLDREALRAAFATFLRSC
jgi:DNA-binding transcriptional regulator YbjK